MNMNINMKKFYKNIFSYIILLYIFLLSANILHAEEAVSPQVNHSVVKEIKIIGHNRITEDTIRFYIYTKTGELYSSPVVREDIKRIYQIGHFDDVSVESKEEADGLILIYAVREKPSIHEMTFSGNDDVSTDDIKGKITIKAGDVLDRGLIKKNIDSIKKLYLENGFYFAEITEHIEETKNGQVDLKFVIAEGEKIRIKNIVFEGNQKFTSRKLKGLLTTQEKGLFSYFTGSGIYKEEVLKGDILKLESFYKDNGYLKIVVYEPEVNINKEEKRIEVTIRIKEGFEYTVGDISVTGDDTFGKEELFQDAVLIKGEVFRWSGLREDIYKINKLYSQKGFAYSDINPVIMLDDNTLKSDITLEISKGKKFYVGNINIKGNDKTRDRVLRREFRFSEGEVFDSWKLERTRERIFNLEFFDDVKLDVKRGEEEDLLDIDVDVKERSTGQFSISAGYSSVENFVFSTQVSFNNLMGRGQRLSFTAEKSAIRKQLVIEFLEPRILDKEISAGFDIFTKRINETNNDSNSYGGGFSLGKELSEYVHGSFRYRFKYLDIKSVANPNRFNEEGITKISSIMPEISRNTVDNFLNPSKGSKLSANAEMAGGTVLGGANFYKFELEGTKYFPFKWKFVGLLHGKIGFAEPYDKDVLIPITERYFLGGMADLRGYNSRDIGPRDGDGPLGGNKVLVLNAELHYPFTEIVRGFIFYDRGNVYGHGIDTDSLFKDRDDDYSLKNMRHTYGVGVRIFTPIGPIGIAYGRRIDRANGESAGEIQLFMGGVMF